MTLPDGVTEARLLAAIEQVVKALRRRFKSRVRGEDDTEQLIRLFCIEVLPKYRVELGGLEGYLYRAAKNRMLNEVRREHGRAVDPECRTCFDKVRGRGPGHPDGQLCDKHLRWAARNETITNLAHPVSMDKVADEHESRTRVESAAEDAAVANELSARIDAELPVELRPFYLQMLAGLPVTLDRKRRVRAAVADILGEPMLTRDDSMPADEVD